MKAKIGIIKAVNFNPENYSEVVRNSFTNLLHDGVEYKQLSAMEHYFNEHFEQVFEDQKSFEKWLTPGQYSFFILPLDLVPSIKHYSDWVKEAYPEKIFDVVLASEEIEVEGQMVTVPTNIVKMIPCGITAFNPEGEMLLDAVIESWNTQAPNKAIDFNVKFYSLTELDNFIASCGSSL